MGREKYRDWTVFCLQLSWTCLYPMAPVDVLKSWMLLATSRSSFFIHSLPKSGLNMWSCWFPCEELLDLSTLTSWSSPSLQFFPAKRKQKMETTVGTKLGMQLWEPWLPSSRKLMTELMSQSWRDFLFIYSKLKRRGKVSFAHINPWRN